MKKRLFILIVSIVFIMAPFMASADESASIGAAINKVDSLFGSSNVGVITVNSEVDPVSFVNSTLGGFLTKFLGLLGIIALGIFLYSGIIFMLSEGDSGKVSNAQNGMVWSAIGLFAIFASYAFINYAIDALNFTTSG